MLLDGILRPPEMGHPCDDLLSGAKLEQLSNLKYLGMMIIEDPSLAKDAKIAAQSETFAYYALKKKLTDLPNNPPLIVLEQIA